MVEQLREFIRDSGLSLMELEKQTGVDHGRLSRFLRGQRDLTYAAGCRIWECLGLKLVRPEPPRKKPGKGK